MATVSSRRLLQYALNRRGALQSMRLLSTLSVPGVVSSHQTSSSLTSMHPSLVFSQKCYLRVQQTGPVPPEKVKPTRAQVVERTNAAILRFDRLPKEKEIHFLAPLRFGAKAPLSYKTVDERILLVLQLYDKIDPTKLTLDTHLMNDLGLDSLDHVEVIMALEDEFGFEIPDGDAEQLMTPKQIAQYVCDKEDVVE